MIKALKFSIYPNDEQKEYLSKVFGCTRFVYNKMLADRIRIYETKSEENIPTPAKYKKEFEWLKEVDSLALANAQMNLDKAYKNFFRDKNVGFPKFKSKKRNKHSFTTNNQKGTVNVVEGKLKIPKLKSLIKIVTHREIKGTIKSTTISRNPSGKYFASILIETEHESLPKNENQVGVDLGISDIAILSNGMKFENPRFIRKSENKLAREQRKMAKMRIGSKNREKQRIRVAKIYEKITNQRKNYLHNITSYLIKNFGFIFIEDLSSSNLMKNKRLSKAIADVSWFEFSRQLKYKAEWNDRVVQKVSRWFPSSQICSECGVITGKKPLHIRNWKCECGAEHDRDINAGINILNEGKRILGMQ